MSVVNEHHTLRFAYNPAIVVLTVLGALLQVGHMHEVRDVSLPIARLISGSSSKTGKYSLITECTESNLKFCGSCPLGGFIGQCRRLDS